LGLGSSNFEPELQAKYPDIKGYAGVGITDPNASINFSLSQGIQTMILRLMSGSEFIEADQEDSSLYIVFLLRIGTEEVYHLFAKRMMLLSNSSY
jgi:hypothetical protein